MAEYNPEMAPTYTGEQPGSIRKFLGELLGIDKGVDRYEDVYGEGVPSYDIASGDVRPIGRRAIRYGDAPSVWEGAEATPIAPEAAPDEFVNAGGTVSGGPVDVSEFSDPDAGFAAVPDQIGPPPLDWYGNMTNADANRINEANIPDDDVQDMDLTGAFPGPGPAAPSTLPPEIADASPLPPGAIGGGNMPPEALALLSGGVPPVNNYVDPYGGLNPDDLPMFQGNPPANLPTSDMDALVGQAMGEAPVPNKPPVNPRANIGSIERSIEGGGGDGGGVRFRGQPPITQDLPSAVPGVAPPPVGAANVQQAPPLPPAIPGGAGGPPQGASGAGPGLPDAPISNVRPPTVPLNQPPIVPPPPAGPSVRTGGPGGATGMAGGIDPRQGGFNLLKTIMDLLPSSSPAAAPNTPRFQRASKPQGGFAGSSANPWAGMKKDPRFN